MRTLLVGVVIMSSLSYARDPFAPPMEPSKPPSTCTSTLCRYELSDLKLVAIASGGAEPAAMFEDRFGRGFVARRNAQVGTIGARVTRIDRDCLTLTRFAADANGRSIPVTERLCLAGSAQVSEHDYLTDGPFPIP